MTEPARNPMSVPGLPSLFEDLVQGVLRWDLLFPWPRQDEQDLHQGEQTARVLRELLDDCADPRTVEETGALPDGLVDRLREAGLLHLAVDPEHGGAGLSPRNVLRVIEAAADWAPAAGLLLAFHNGLGVPAYLPVLAEGPLLDHLRKAIAAGALTGAADTEPEGAANAARHVTATPVEDGAAYLLNGRKIFIGNGPIADLLTVTATVEEPDGKRIRQFFVHTTTPGFSVAARHDYLGLRGMPSGLLVFEDVRVPAELVLSEEQPGVWRTPHRSYPLARGRLQIIAPPSAAIIRQCLEYARDFLARRRVNGRPLADYDEIQRGLATSLAELYALESVVEWTTLADADGREINLVFDRFAAKNITSLLAWRTVERTLTLLAGEGYETARSKERRQAAALPLERMYRDARGLRIAGGVESLLQARLGLIALSYFPVSPAEPAGGTPTDPTDLAGLSERNLANWRAVADGSRELARLCARLTERWPDRRELAAQDHLLVQLGLIIEELLTMGLVLARTADGACPEGARDGQALADLFCAGAGHRIADARRRIDALVEGTEPDCAAVAAGWLAERGSGQA
ncbi:acyl-CoA dehydrogenase family protein [Streptomyces sp. NPDC048717]|uniref:acyl-CoA dehydrogenase family protein n=1 Tax=unclassified Streptomyces TaxID=2593676 RepID=UPI003449AF08